MKSLKTCAVSVLLLLCYTQSSAQNKPVPTIHEDYNKPKLFSDLPQKMKLDIKAYEALLALPVGETVKTPLIGKAHLFGTIVSKSDPNDLNVSSIVVKCKNRLGATLTFTRLRNTDGTISYIGRIISFKHIDAFEIVQENGEYLLIKKDLYDLVSE